MRYLICIIGLFFLPLTGHAQINVDTLEAFVDNDKDCGDFQGIIEATRHHHALKVIVNDPDADPHSLDRDGNGVACEGKTVLRRKYIRSDSSSYDNPDEGYWVETREVPHRVHCPTVPESFTLEEYTTMARDAIDEQVNYLAGTEVGIWSGMDCLHSIGVIKEAL